MLRLFGDGVGGGRRGQGLVVGLVVALAVVALCLVVPGKTLASVTGDTYTESIEFDNIEMLKPLLRSSYVSQNNTVKVVVVTSSADAEVKFGAVATIKADGTIETRQTGLGDLTGKSGTPATVYTVEHYPLRPGANRLSIMVKVGKKRETFRFTINYPDVSTVNAKYYVGNIMGERKIEAFNKTVILDLGRDNFIAKSDGTLAVPSNPAIDQDQSVTIGVHAAPVPDKQPNGFMSISPVFEVAAAETDHRIGMPGTLTLKYTGLGAVPGNITVFRSAGAGDFSGAENVGGLVDQRAGTITVAFEGAFSGHYGVFASVIGAETYADLPPGGWYYHAVSALRAKGVMEPANTAWGYADPGTDNFGLASTIIMCRGEFAFMMVRALGLPLLNVDTKDDVPFKDVKEGTVGKALYVRAVETAAFHGLIRGYPDHTFHPRVGDTNGLLTREQAAVIIARAAGLRLNTIEASVNASLARLYSDYKDAPDWIPAWARSSVLACHRAGLMTGFPNVTDGVADGTYRFYDDPANKQLTRAQAAAVMHRFMENQKLI